MIVGPPFAGATLPLTFSRSAHRSARTLCAAAVVHAAVAAAGEPLYVKNLSPLAGLLGLPSQRDAAIGEPGAVTLALHAGVASHYVAEGSDAEFLRLDGETARLALELRYALSRDWDLQLELPWLEHSGGHLDRAIDNWHHLWGMSDGGRGAVPRDRLDYRYRGATARFTLRDRACGPGDISLALSHAFYRRDRTVASAMLGYKFGTAREPDLLGSGADDVYLGLRLSGAQPATRPLLWHGQLGYLRAGASDTLRGAQARDLWFAGLALDWRVGRRWSLVGQLDGHAAPLDSDLTAVGDAAWLLTLGARWRFAADWSVDVSVVEDLQVSSAPDVTFQASLRYRPAES